MSVAAVDETAEPATPEAAELPLGGDQITEVRESRTDPEDTDQSDEPAGLLVPKFPHIGFPNEEEPERLGPPLLQGFEDVWVYPTKSGMICIKQYNENHPSGWFDTILFPPCHVDRVIAALRDAAKVQTEEAA